MSELVKFIFEGLPVRGMLVRLTDAWQEVLRRRETVGPHAPEVRVLLGEMAAAGVLMQGNIKFNGALVLQIFGDGPVKLAVAEHMAEVHMSVTEISNEFREKMRRYNYVTPKSFLELISFYRHLLGVKRDGVGKNIKRLDDGLAKLKQTSADVAELKIDVQKAMLRAEEEVKATDILVAQMQKQTAEANVEKDKADLALKKPNLSRADLHARLRRHR